MALLNGPDQSLAAELHDPFVAGGPSRVATFGDPVGEHDQGFARFHGYVTSPVDGIGQRAEDRTQGLQLEDLGLGRHQQGWAMAAVDVGHVAGFFEFPVKQGDETAGQTAAVNHPVQAADGRGDLFPFGLTHAHTDNHVPGLQGGGQTVAAGVGEHQTEGSFLDPLDIVDVASHLFGGMAHRGDLESFQGGQTPGQQGMLDGLGLFQLVDVGLFAEFQAYGRPDGFQEHQEIVFAAVVPDSQTQDVGRFAPDEDGRRIHVAELGLQVRVPAGRLGGDDPQPATLNVLDHLVLFADGLAGDLRSMSADTFDQEEIQLPFPVQTAADDTEISHVVAFDQQLQDVQ